MAKVSLEGLDRALVLAALYNAARPQGLGFLHYDPEPMTVEQAKEILAQRRAYRKRKGQGNNQRQNRWLLRDYYYFDYLQGRVMKIDLCGKGIESAGYDRDNGEGAVAQIIEVLRASNEPNAMEIQVAHIAGRADAIPAALDMMSGGPKMNEQDFIALGKQRERIGGTDTIDDVIAKMSDGNPGAEHVLGRLFAEDQFAGFMNMLLLDTKRLYGYRIWELFKLCGQDLKRFVYHLDMELPNQATGELSITGPYCSRVDNEAHFAVRTHGKPGSFWALANPPTDPNYKYPIVVSVSH